jgi:hypothetical protein
MIGLSVLDVATLEATSPSASHVQRCRMDL